MFENFVLTYLFGLVIVSFATGAKYGLYYAAISIGVGFLVLSFIFAIAALANYLNGGRS